MSGGAGENISVCGLGLQLARAGARNNAPALLFIHGWGGRSAVFRHQLAHFGDRYLCLAPDLPGHGASAKPQLSYTIPFFAEILESLLNQQLVQKAVAVGHSMGALIALALAERLGGDRIPALALIEPAPVLPPRAVARGLEKTAYLLETEGLPTTLRRLLAAAFLEPSEDTAAVEKEAMAGAAAVPDFVAKACWRAMQDYRAEAVLARLRQPLAVILGHRPQIDFGQWRARVQAPLLLGRTLGAGHFNLLTVPGQVNAMLDTFLARLPALTA